VQGATLKGVAPYTARRRVELARGTHVEVSDGSSESGRVEDLLARAQVSRRDLLPGLTAGTRAAVGRGRGGEAGWPEAELALEDGRAPDTGAEEKCLSMPLVSLEEATCSST
jgi:hypothetical protein